MDTAQSYASSAGSQPSLAAARVELLETFSNPRAGKSFSSFQEFHAGGKMGMGDETGSSG